MIKKSLRLLFIFSFFLCYSFHSKAQEITDDGMGKTFYDDAKKHFKEIFHYILEFQMLINPENDEELINKTVIIKNGPYTSYYINGVLESSGYYKRNSKDSTWRYYDVNGVLRKVELYRNNQLVR
jgi:antitoxin component YwqK of YwqJK toxin-antitoxin module